MRQYLGCAEVDAAEAKAVRGRGASRGRRGGGEGPPWRKKRARGALRYRKGRRSRRCCSGALEPSWGFEASEAKARHDADEAPLSLQDGFFRCFELHAAFAATAASSPRSISVVALPAVRCAARILQSSSVSSAPSPSSVDEISYSALPVIRAAATRVRHAGWAVAAGPREYPGGA